MNETEKPRTLIQKYGGNAAGAFWLASNILLTSSVGLGGTWAETTAGIINISGSLTSGLLGHLKWGPAALAFQALLGQTILQASRLADGDLLSFVGYAATVIGCVPAMTEPLTRNCAASYIEKHKGTRNLWDKTKLLACKSFADSRVTFAIFNSLCLPFFMMNDIIHHHYHVVPCYIGWLIGNICFALSKPPERNTVATAKPALNEAKP